ncbi:MAG: peptide chain release factor 3 [Bacteroidales bacterium]|nr:peptide chain release factor 3 [Bacteroidales bacterium]
MNLMEEIARRRTFAIVSHPDAGKTTLTEKLLLFGGAIHVAGAVKSNKIKKTTVSDFMEIEKQRGISVSTSVMGFEYNNYKVNILDTPGHQDFAEDTYRTLSAVDSVIIVIDAAKGVETQTEKLSNVCRMRKTPSIFFINKLDREGLDPFLLLDEIEKKLNISCVPMTWPIGMGKNFKGVFQLHTNKLYLFDAEEKQRLQEPIIIENLDKNQLSKYIGEQLTIKLIDEIELVRNVYPQFSRTEYLNGNIAPVFFGSALNNFGVKELLETFLQIAPSPRNSETNERIILPQEEKFTGFVFKIHANLHPQFRARIAFIKICSGIFKRNVPYFHVRSGKYFKFSNPTSFMAAKQSVIDEAYPGDIVGVHDTGNFKIGDTFTEGEVLQFKGIPSFSPELFRYIENNDPSRYKQLAKGIEQLTDEGVAQLFTHKLNGRKIIGTVGALQFEVIQFRLEHEYAATCRYENLPLYKACWFKSKNPVQLNEFKKRKANFLAEDKYGRDVFLADSAFTLQMAKENFPDIEFYFTSEFN